MFSCRHVVLLIKLHILNLPAVKTEKYTAWTISRETVGMAKSRTRKNQSERSDLPYHIIIYITLFLHVFYLLIYIFISK